MADSGDDLLSFSFDGDDAALDDGPEIESEPVVQAPAQVQPTVSI